MGLEQDVLGHLKSKAFDQNEMHRLLYENMAKQLKAIRAEAYRRYVMYGYEGAVADIVREREVLDGKKEFDERHNHLCLVQHALDDYREDPLRPIIDMMAKMGLSDGEEHIRE